MRRISIPQEAVDLLTQEQEKSPDNPYMFLPPNTDEMYYPDSVVKLREKIPMDARLERIRFHDLRHTFATLALQKRRKHQRQSPICWAATINAESDHGQLYGADDVTSEQNLKKY